jgi:hypothetical protein
MKKKVVLHNEIEVIPWGVALFGKLSWIAEAHRMRNKSHN